MVGIDDAAGVGEGGEALVRGGGADAAAVAQLGEWHGAGDVGKCCGDALVERALARCGRRRGVGRIDAVRQDRGPRPPIPRRVRDPLCMSRSVLQCAISGNGLALLSLCAP